MPHIYDVELKTECYKKKQEIQINYCEYHTTIFCNTKAISVMCEKENRVVPQRVVTCLNISVLCRASEPLPAHNMLYTVCYSWQPKSQSCWSVFVKQREEISSYEVNNEQNQPFLGVFLNSVHSWSLSVRMPTSFAHLLRTADYFIQGLKKAKLTPCIHSGVYNE
jgi:hypothetical protein